MKTLSAFNQTAVDNPHVDVIRLVTINFSGAGPVIYLCDRVWGDSGSECIFNGQLYEPLILKWGTIDQGKLDPVDHKYTPGNGDKFGSIHYELPAAIVLDGGKLELS